MTVIVPTPRVNMAALDKHWVGAVLYGCRPMVTHLCARDKADVPWLTSWLLRKVHARRVKERPQVLSTPFLGRVSNGSAWANRTAGVAEGLLVHCLVHTVRHCYTCCFEYSV